MPMLSMRAPCAVQRSHYAVELLEVADELRKFNAWGPKRLGAYLID